jgi:hypothetical protein
MDFLYGQHRISSDKLEFLAVMHASPVTSPVETVQQQSS